MCKIAEPACKLRALTSEAVACLDLYSKPELCNELTLNKAYMLTKACQTKL